MNPLLVHPLVGLLSILLAYVAFRLDSERETRGAAHRIVGTLSVVLGGVALWMGLQASLGSRAPTVLIIHRFLGIATFSVLLVVGVLGVASEGGRKAIGRVHGAISKAVLILGGLLVMFGLAGLDAIIR
ncbi:hypothetical protein [Caldinitratiruptor microaerophilus]|uniref:Cytochrome b561 domain-containing protein n=1 Tax=Caldinitratiruptor microaerophilus TaxID=671077 RepID=A0AA35G5I0_9FIRM|nr:hypothetical protein [Caldinitratiruptor microaerophilus]BDG59461.1 hypothetical protein caldi_05510 [Caldinitratiruptor microaerophilus]